VGAQPVGTQRGLQLGRVLELPDGDIDVAVGLLGHRPGGQPDDGGMAACLLAGHTPPRQAAPAAVTPDGAAPGGGERPPDGSLSAARVFAALNQVRPDHAVLVEESPSNLPDLHTAWPVTEPDTFYTFASGGLGWDLPAAVGVALAERDSGCNRPVIAVIGDGSVQYSVQSIWTAARLRLPMLIVVVQNQEYAILKSFAMLEQAPGVPGLDIPGLDIVSVARGYGCDATRVADLDRLKQAVAAAWTKQVPTVLEIPISAQVPPLL
jgi:benzoylformate decarboxylase